MAAGVKSGKKRASGETTAAEITKEESERLDQPIDDKVLHEEREKQFRTPGFARMRLDWTSEDRIVIERAKQAVDGRILKNFIDAYEVMNVVFDLVRTPEFDIQTGEIKVDRWGFKIWKQNQDGSYDEDFTRLTLKQKEDLLFKITTRLFEWAQRAGDAWGEAMLAKSQWEERFSREFDQPMSGTVDDRRAVGNIGSVEERYFAIFLTWYSRRADAIVRSVELLGQRLKDSMG